MGKTKKLYLTRRILAMILAAAMTVTMLPSTALAAPAGDDVEEGVVNVAAEETGDVNAPEDEGELQDTADVPDDDNKGVDDATTAEEKTEVDAEGDAPAAKPVYEIVLSNGFKSEAVYDGNYQFASIRSYVTLKKDGSAIPYGENDIVCTWKQKGADGTYADMGTTPKNVGSYQVLLSYPKVEGVHDGAELGPVDCEIKAKPLTISVKTINAKPGDSKDSVKDKVEIDSIDVVSADAAALTKDVIALEVTDVRDAITNASLKAEDKLKKNGDYVVDITPSLKADASAEAKEAAKNYEIKPFTADIKMGELTDTKIEITYATKWEENGRKVTLHVYDGKPAKSPALETDYTYEVQYWDETQKKYLPLTDDKGAKAVAVGEWKKDSRLKIDENTGKVLPPTEADEYTYRLVYTDETGVYTESDAEITVVIDPAPVTVAITNKAEIKVPAGTLMTKALSQVTYEAKAKDRDDKYVAINVKENHIWGTGYDDSNVSQVYEPAFTLQVQDGTKWKDIGDASYRMEEGKTYRIIYDGKKAIYNADGTYAHRTDINSGLDAGEEINGVSTNYTTDETPTADDQALTVTVQPGVEVDWDLETLLKDGKANETLDGTPAANDYNGAPIYSAKSDYKNKVKLKGVTETSKSLTAIGKDFTYTWFKNYSAYDLIDIKIADENKKNGFSYREYENSWSRLGNITAPTEAGIYKLEISYQDNTDDGTFYYLKEDKPAEVYFVINKVQLTVNPKDPAEGKYTTLAGRTPDDFFSDNVIKYEMLDKDSKEYKAPAGVGELVPEWKVIEHTTDESGTAVDRDMNRWRDSFATQNPETKKPAYEIQAYELLSLDSDGYYYTNDNYTFYQSNIVEIGEANADGKKRVDRDNGELLNGKVDLNVNPMGTTKLEVTPTTPVAYEKTYDGKWLTLAEVKPEAAYTLTNKETGQQVPVKELDILYLCINKVEPEDESMLEWRNDAGEYNLYACFSGNETYAPFDLGPEPTVPGVLIGTVKINKRPISLTLKVDDTYEAGYKTKLREDMTHYQVTGYVQNDECDDEWAFSRDEEGYVYAWNRGPSFSIYEKGSKIPYTDNILHRNKEFEIRYDAENSRLDAEYDRNYEVTTKDGAILCTFKTVAAPAGIEPTSVGSGSVKSLTIAPPEVKRDNNGGISQTVNVLEGISYSQYSGRDVDNKSVNMKGNLAAFRIYAPAEFGGQIPVTAMYKNEVETAGGKVLSKNNYSFVVLFDASNGPKTFNIRWEDKYVEKITLNFDTNQCLGDLTNAVAPKSLAFNDAPKKLAIGSSVQLDVKITKKQMADVIRLGYESSDETVLRVNSDTGYVTALKKAKATITVYPMHMDEATGEIVPIKGAKTAKVTIEGVPVTAPKPVKVTTHGTYVDVDYSALPDGYRREVYVASGKLNAKAIEEKVKNLQGIKNQWKDDFAIAPIYLDSADEAYNRNLSKDYTTGQYTARLTGLKINEQYTVYVRNVCEAKTLPDGNVITQSTVDASASGTAVSFKTLKSEELGLDLKLDETMDGIRDVTGYDTNTVPEFYTGTRTYVVEFSKLTKGLNSTTLGQFALNALDEAADSNDRINLELPLKEKKYKDAYQDPKLEYYVWAYDKNGDSVRAQKNDFVSIDKKGKIKLTGVKGWYNDWEGNWGDPVTVYVRDASLDSTRTARINLIIVADVDSVTAKKKTMNLSVGQEVELNDIALYTYKAGKTKLTSYDGPNMDMEAVRMAVKEKKDFFELNGTTLRAIKGGGKLELSLTDKNVKKVSAANATTKITFVSKDLAPVKKIKAYDITNDRFGLTFTHAGGADAFRVEIIDSSKKKLLDKRYELYSDVNELWQFSGNQYRRVKDTYHIIPSQIKDDVLAGGGKLAKESQYTVTITALYDGISTKPASGKVKTTKIPAWDSYRDDYYDWDYDAGKYVLVKIKGGMGIQVSEGGTDSHLDDGTTGLRVLSGNSYTLTAEPSNRGRVDDTLVWTIDNKKVASVKAAAGTYCITLKGLKPGNAVLEVKSKILGNKVIARYDITVVAVGNAYGDGYSNPRYYGDNEPGGYTEPTTPGGLSDSKPDYLPLSVGDPRKVLTSQYNYFSFTAPETAVYTFKTVGNAGTLNLYKRNGTSWSWCNSNLGWLTEGTTVYLRSYVTGSAVNGAYYVEIETTNRMEPVEAGTTTVTGKGNQEYFEFKAPESGRYQFTLSYGSNSKVTLYLYETAQNAINGYPVSDNGQTIEREIAKDGRVWLKTNSSLTRGTEYTLEVKKISEDAVFGTPKEVTLAAGETKYLMYTIEKDGYYQFSSAEPARASSDVRGEITVNKVSRATISSSSFDEKLELGQGDEVCLKVTNNGSDAETFTVNTADITPKNLSTVTGDVAIPAGNGTLYQFTATEGGAYQFTMMVDTTNASNARLKIWNSISDANRGYEPLAESIDAAAGEDGKSVISVDVLLNAGQTVYVNPINNSGSEMTVSVDAAKDDSISAIGGTGEENITVTKEPVKVTFTAEKAGIYTFTANPEKEVIFYLYKSSAYSTNGSEASKTIKVDSKDPLSEKLLMYRGQTILWMMEATSELEPEPDPEEPEVQVAAEITVSFKAELTNEIKELVKGQSATASITSSGTADGFVFTVPSDGDYTFWSEGAGETDSYGILYDIAKVDPEKCLLYDNKESTGCLDYNDDGDSDWNFAIKYTLKKGQVVYLKCLFRSNVTTGTYSVFVE